MRKQTTLYKGYAIERIRYQGIPAYRVFRLNGTAWTDMAATLATARRWIDCELARACARKWQAPV